MKEIRLNGLNLDGFPIAGLVAYGLLRLLEQKGYRVKLRFDDPRSRPCAVLVVEDELLEHFDPDSLSYWVLSLLQEIDPATRGAVLVRKERRGRIVEDYPRISELRQIGVKLDPAFQSAYFPRAEEKEEKQEEQKERYTPLDTSKGQQNLIKTYAQCRALLLLEPRRAIEAIRRVLFDSVLLLPGDTLFEERFPRIGWHPSQFRYAAGQARIPSLEPFQETVRINPAAVVLAWEALPFYSYPQGADLPVGILLMDGRYRLITPTPPFPVTSHMLKALLAGLSAYPLAISNLPVWLSERVGSKKQTDHYPCFTESIPLLKINRYLSAYTYLQSAL